MSPETVRFGTMEATKGPQNHYHHNYHNTPRRGKKNTGIVHRKEEAFDPAQLSPLHKEAIPCVIITLQARRLPTSAAYGFYSKSGY